MSTEGKMIRMRHLLQRNRVTYPRSAGPSSMVCYPIIDKNQKLYLGAASRCKNVNLESVEHHLIEDPDYHKSEILRLLSANFTEGKT